MRTLQLVVVSLAILGGCDPTGGEGSASKSDPAEPLDPCGDRARTAYIKDLEAMGKRALEGVSDQERASAERNNAIIVDESEKAYAEVCKRSDKTVTECLSKIETLLEIEKEQVEAAKACKGDWDCEDETKAKTAG